MAYWLVKSEADDYSIEQLERDRTTEWTGVRNYQARNYLREMKRGEQILFYHSNSEPTGIVGLARVDREAQPDALQFDRKSDYFDPKATTDAPRWFCPRIAFVQRFPAVLELSSLREVAALKDMVLLRRGSRLSVQPVGIKEFEAILKLAKGAQ